MAFIRVSVMTPKEGQEARVASLLDDLTKLYAGKPGFITAYLLKPVAGAGARTYGRISIWNSREDTQRMAMEPHDMALQSELRLVCDETSHEEHSFEGDVVGG